MSESDNITRNLLGKLLRTEVSIIRSYRAFLMLLPIHDLLRINQGLHSCNAGNDSNLLIVFYVQIMPDDLVMQLHRF